MRSKIQLGASGNVAHAIPITDGPADACARRSSAANLLIYVDDDVPMAGTRRPRQDGSSDDDMTIKRLIGTDPIFTSESETDVTRPEVISPCRL